jgi:hypothetical protein
MVFAKITGAGLTCIALSVSLLWGCIVGEHLIVQRANRDFTQAMTQIRQLQSKRRAEPASVPLTRHQVRPAVS